MRYTYHGIAVESGRILDSALFTPAKEEKPADPEKHSQTKPQEKKPARRKK